MKKIFTLILAVSILSVAAIPSLAQGRDSRRRVYYDNQTSNTRVYDRGYYDSRYRDRSFWDKHRDKLTVAGGTVGGAILGSLFGGRKGAVIGALAGGGDSALYTYKVRDRHRTFWH